MRSVLTVRFAVLSTPYNCRPSPRLCVSASLRQKRTMPTLDLTAMSLPWRQHASPSPNPFASLRLRVFALKNWRHRDERRDALDYQTFLDKELNQAYSLLMAKLPPARQAELKTAQRHWIAFRDAEFELIKNNWTRENFGSSAGMSQGAYRCSLIKNRVIQLLYYAINY